MIISKYLENNPRQAEVEDGYFAELVLSQTAKTAIAGHEERVFRAIR